MSGALVSGPWPGWYRACPTGGAGGDEPLAPRRPGATPNVGPVAGHRRDDATRRRPARPTAVSACAAAIARVRKNRWLADRKPRDLGPPGCVERQQRGQQRAAAAGWSPPGCARGRRRPSATACAASDEHVDRPGALDTPRRAAGRRPRAGSTSRAIAAGVSRPNHGDVARALVRAARTRAARRPAFSTTQTGAERPIAVAIGTTAAELVGRRQRAPRPSASRRSAPRRRPPSPPPPPRPASTGAAGRRRRPRRSPGPACSSVAVLRGSGTHLARRPDAGSSGTPVSSRRSTSALAVVDRSRSDARRAGAARRPAPGRRRPASASPPAPRAGPGPGPPRRTAAARR